jgi:hypothetical protein
MCAVLVAYDSALTQLFSSLCSLSLFRASISFVAREGRKSEKMKRGSLGLLVKVPQSGY